MGQPNFLAALENDNNIKSLLENDIADFQSRIENDLTNTKEVIFGE